MESLNIEYDDASLTSGLNCLRYSIKGSLENPER